MTLMIVAVSSISRLMVSDGTVTQARCLHFLPNGGFQPHSRLSRQLGTTYPVTNRIGFQPIRRLNGYLSKKYQSPDKVLVTFFVRTDL